MGCHSNATNRGTDFSFILLGGHVKVPEVGGDRIEYVLKTQTPEGKPVEQVFTTTPVAIDLDLPKILRDRFVNAIALLRASR